MGGGTFAPFLEPPPPKLRLQRGTVFQENPQDMYILVQWVVKLFVQCAVACTLPSHYETLRDDKCILQRKLRGVK